MFVSQEAWRALWTTTIVRQTAANWSDMGINKKAPRGVSNPRGALRAQHYEWQNHTKMYDCGQQKQTQKKTARTPDRREANHAELRGGRDYSHTWDTTRSRCGLPIASVIARSVSCVREPA